MGKFGRSRRRNQNICAIRIGIRRFILAAGILLAFPWVGTFAWMQARGAVEEHQKLREVWVEKEARCENTAASDIETGTGVEAVPMIVIERDGAVTKRKIEDYLPGVVACQMPEEIFEQQVWQCQAVIARTYIKSLLHGRTEIHEEELDLDILEINGDSQVVEKLLKAEQAVRETGGMVMKYHGEYILPLFHELSAGKTRAGGDEFPYLMQASCALDVQNPDYQKVFDFSWDDFLSRIKRITDSEMSISGGIGGNIQIIKKDSAGYVEQLMICGRTYTGDELRYSLELPSACFTVIETDDGVRFITCGVGHGYGLSQYGAQSMALEGCGYDEILHYFYKDIAIEQE